MLKLKLVLKPTLKHMLKLKLTLILNLSLKVMPPLELTLILKLLLVILLIFTSIRKIRNIDKKFKAFIYSPNLICEVCSNKNSQDSPNQKFNRALLFY